MRAKSELISQIRSLTPKQMTLDQINFNKGVREDAEIFSLIDPVLNTELNDAKRKFNYFESCK